MKRPRHLALSLAITGLGLSAIVMQASATPPGKNGRIAFASDGNGNFDIHAMNADGSGDLDIADISNLDLEPAWSPDGAKIAFRSGSRNSGEIYTMNADGTALMRLTSDAFRDRFPAWSADGSMIAFVSNRNDPNFATCVDTGTCNEDVFVMPATGGSPQPLTTVGGHTGHPQFSPDGRFIAYESDADGYSAVYKLDLQTLQAKKLTPGNMQAGEPDWSPDGAQIAFINNFACPKVTRNDCKSDIFVMNSDGESITQLTDKFGNNIDPHWSPQGDKIVFGCGKNLQVNRQQICTMNADGTGITEITHDNNNNLTPAWGPQ